MDNGRLLQWTVDCPPRLLFIGGPGLTVDENISVGFNLWRCRYMDGVRRGHAHEFGQGRE